jgi:hypothetical protein
LKNIVSEVAIMRPLSHCFRGAKTHLKTTLSLTPPLTSLWVKFMPIEIIPDKDLENQIAQAIASGEAANQSEPRANRVCYDEVQDAIVIYLKNDLFLGIPRRLLQGLDRATTEELQDFWLTSNGDAVHWDSLNVSFGITGLVNEVYGTQQWMNELMASASR